MTIIENKIKCNKCEDIIESKHRHDFVWCKCRSCAVDGGKDYLKRIGKPDDWTDMSTVERQDEDISILSNIIEARKLLTELRPDESTAFVISENTEIKWQAIELLDEAIKQIEEM